MVGKEYKEGVGIIHGMALCLMLPQRCTHATPSSANLASEPDIFPLLQAPFIESNRHGYGNYVTLTENIASRSLPGFVWIHANWRLHLSILCVLHIQYILPGGCIHQFTWFSGETIDRDDAGMQVYWEIMLSSLIHGRSQKSYCF